MPRALELRGMVATGRIAVATRVGEISALSQGVALAGGVMWPSGHAFKAGRGRPAGWGPVSHRLSHVAPTVPR